MRHARVPRWLVPLAILGLPGCPSLCRKAKCPATNVRIQTARSATVQWTLGEASGTGSLDGKAKDDQLASSVPRLTTAPGHSRPVPQHIRASIVLPLSMSCTPGVGLARSAGVVPERVAVSLFLGDPGDWKVGSYDLHPEWAGLQVKLMPQGTPCNPGRADCAPLCSSTTEGSQIVLRVAVQEAIGTTRRPPPGLFDGDFLRRFSVHLEVPLDAAVQSGAECVPWSFALDADFTVVDEDYTYDPDNLCPCHGPRPPTRPPGPAEPPAPRYRSGG